MRGIALVAAVVAFASSTAFAQATRVHVRGGEKAIREQVIALLSASPGALPPVNSGLADARIDLQKSGGAKVKYGSAEMVLPGPSAADIVAQFRAWLPLALEARRAAQVAREEAQARFREDLTAAALALSAAQSAEGPLTSLRSQKLMIFGGRSHETYLGCLNCSEFAADSVRNEFGKYGNSFGSNLFNSFSPFGSKFGTYSACNPLATDPPVIVDEAGNFYGRLTVNADHRQRTKDPQLQGWIAGVCAG
jgi:hypothetical protein